MVLTNSFLTFHEIEPRNGRTMETSFFGAVWTVSLFSKILLKNLKMHHKREIHKILTHHDEDYVTLTNHEKKQDLR